MAAILDHCGVSRAVVGGLSLGGYMSLAFYLAHPERVRALMLFDTGPGYRNPEARAGWNRLAERRAQALEQQGLDMLREGSDEVRSSVHHSAAGLAHAARGMLAQFDSRVIDSLPRIAVPTLVLVGQRDEPFLAATDVMTAKIPHAIKVVIPDAGHAANLHQPEAFNRAVEEFLRALGSSENA
jgi:pimeloyl-ACP methyl ester carboxylesterase